MTDRLSQMLELQRKLQVNSYGGIDPGELPVEERIQFIKDTVLAITDELHEILGEVDWKPWTHGERQINNDGVKKEIIDCWHFFMNMMLAVGMTTDDLYKMYVKKRQVNETRQLNSYDGRTTKCAGCKRALEDVIINKIVFDTEQKYACQCGYFLNSDVASQFITD